MARKIALTVEKPQRQQTPLDLLVDDYLASCRARNLAFKTVQDNYGYPLRSLFLPWAADQGITEPSELTQRVLDRFTARIVSNPISEWTAHSYIRPVRQLLKYAERMGDVDKAAVAQLPRLNRRAPNLLTREEIDSLEYAADSERDKVIVRILGDTGMRVGEVCKLTLNATTRQERGPLLRVNGKGGDQRLVPIRPELARRIERYQRSRPKATSDQLFLSRRCMRGEYQPITSSAVRQMLRNVMHRAGVNKRVYPHLFRHSFATEALRRGMNPVVLAKILGHRSLQMIDRVYSHLNTDDAYDAVMRMLTT